MPKKRHNAEEFIHKPNRAQALIDQWQVFYETKRPHSSLSYGPPPPERKYLIREYLRGKDSR